MSYKSIMTAVLSALILVTTSGCGRSVRTARDITPGNPTQKMDWRYGTSDIRIQTWKLTSLLFDRWYAKTNFDCSCCKPRLIITEVDNRTNCYISTDMIRDIFESCAADDGRFTVVVGNSQDEFELDRKMDRIQLDPKYQNSSRLASGNATAPEFLAKVRITKAVTSDRYFDYEDYRMTVTLYDIETQEIVDSAWDVLSKKVKGC